MRSRYNGPTIRLRGMKECERMQWLPLESTAREKCVAGKEREDNTKKRQVMQRILLMCEQESHQA